MRWYLLVVRICSSLVISSIEHLLTFLLAICMSSLGKCLLRSYTHFLIKLFVFWILMCIKCLYIWMLAHYWSCHLKYKMSQSLHLHGVSPVPGHFPRLPPIKSSAVRPPLLLRAVYTQIPCKVVSFLLPRQQVNQSWNPMFFGLLLVPSVLFHVSQEMGFPRGVYGK